MARRGDFALLIAGFKIAMQRCRSGLAYDTVDRNNIIRKGHRLEAAAQLGDPSLGSTEGREALVQKLTHKSHRQHPVRDVYPVPRQVFRGDFPRPDAPWLVVLFSSMTCASCASMRDKVMVLESSEVAACDVEFQSQREVHERYEISGVPMVLIADDDGVVVRAFVGATSATDLWAAVAGVRDPEIDPEPDLGAMP